jgi:FMNH2-dependent dimethyl sulfone monooxygenase
MTFGVSGYAVVRDSDEEARAEVARITDVKSSARGYANYQQWISGSKLEQRVSLEDYSVSNRGLRSGFVGTPEAVKERLEEFAAVGVDLVLLQSSPQAEEMERFSAQVIRG